MRYFIDTNVIIDFLDGKQDAIDILFPLLQDSNTSIYINRLVMIESLRGIKYTHSNKFKQAKEALEQFQQLDIKEEIYLEAINFARFCRSKGITLKGSCEVIDFLHFITAKHYDLELISSDNDFEKLEEKYNEFK